MYALADITEGDCYLRVPPDPGTVAAALGASAAAALGASASAAPGAGTSPLSGTAPTKSLHTFTLDSGASRSFFPCSRRLVGLLRSPLLAPQKSQSLHTPRLSYPCDHCTCSWTGRHLATFTRRPGLSLYTVTTAPPPVSASGQVAAYSQVFAAASRSSPASAPCSCRPLAHETLLWHHRLGHPSLPRLRGMASRALVSGLPRSLPPLPPGPALTCVPCVEGRQRAAPHSSSFPLTEAPLQTLHMDTRGARHQLSERFGSDLPVLGLHSDKGGEFSSDLLRAFCRSEGIRQTFTLPASPQQNGIAERRIGMVMDVARTSMIHAAAPHFLWPFAVQYAAHQINLQPRVSLPETTPTLRWTGKVGDASAFCVWGSQAFVRNTTADKLSSGAVPCVFLGFPPDAPGWQFDHPTSRRVLSSRVVTFDESGPAPSGVSQVDPAELVKVAVDSGAARGAETRGVETGGSESVGALGVPSRREPLSPQRLRKWYSRRCQGAAGAGGAGGARGATGGAGAAGGGAGAGAAGAAGGAGAAGSGAGAGATGGAAGAGAPGGAAGAVGVGVAIGATGGAGAAGGGAGAGAAGGAAGVGAGAAGGAAGTGDPGAEGTVSVSAVSRGAARPRPYYVPLLPQVLGSPPSPGPPPPFLSPPPVQSQSQLQPAPPLPGPSPYSGPSRGLTERREPESHPVSPVRTVRAGRASCPRLPPVRGTHSMTQRPSTASQRVPLPSPPTSSLPVSPDLESDSLRAASPTVTRFLATAVTDPLFESCAASTLVAELVDFAAACRLDYATSLVAASASVCPPSIGGECALGTDVLEDRQEDLECFAAASPHLVSMLLAPEGDPDALVVVLITALDPLSDVVSVVRSTPLPTGHSLSAPPSDESVEPSGPYPELVGCLMYLMTCTRLDLAYPLSLLARYVAPGRHRKVHWDAAKRVLRYLCSTSGMGLVLGGQAQVVLTGHADASWVDDLDTQRSSQGYTFSLGSGSVSWRSTRSSSVLSSSCEAEIYAGAIAAQELCWLTYLLIDLGEAPRSSIMGSQDGEGSSAPTGSGTQETGIVVQQGARTSQASLLKEVLRNFNVEKFNGDGYDDWSYKMQLYFRQIRLLKLMTGEEKRPSDPSLQVDWDERLSAGYYLLSQSLELNQRQHIMHFLPEEECGPRAWAVLKDLHAPTSVVATLMLERELSSLRLSEGEPVQVVIDKIRDIYAKLAAAGVTYLEKAKCLKMLSLLPESWLPFTSGLSLPQNQNIWTL
ncbi:unnamed protein product [Closterium sp. NIES-54]